MAEGYYECTSAGFLVGYSGCGDGVASNGPPEVSVFNAKHDPNQRSGTLGFEVCDDAGAPDPGCAADCKSITDGYECLRWGAPCTLKCGNGHVEGERKEILDAVTGLGTGVYKFVYELDADGNQREECDFGAFNSPDNYADIPNVNIDPTA